jgi:hypothetical protein
MPGGLGPRFALEAGFLIVLAAVAAYARLDAAEIIVVMAAGWLLASIFEVLAARRERTYAGAAWERPAEAEARSETAEEDAVEKDVSWTRRPAEVVSPEPEAAGPVEPKPSAPVEPEPAPAPAPEPRVEDEATGEIELPKRRRWFRRGGPDADVTTEEVEARPSARHVRLIRGVTPPIDEADQRKDAEAGS